MLSVLSLGEQPQKSRELIQFGARLSQRSRTQACANPTCAKRMPPLPIGNLIQGTTPWCPEVPSREAGALAAKIHPEAAFWAETQG